MSVMLPKDVKLRVCSDTCSRSIKLVLFSSLEDYVLPEIELVKKPVDKSFIAPSPLCNISEENAQSLMDDLWTVGIRPTEGKGSAGALAATQEHLQDLRKLVFDPRYNIKKG